MRITKDEAMTHLSVGVIAVAHKNSYGVGRYYWKAYMGLVSGFDVHADRKTILDWGRRLSVEEAKGFFPNLDIEQYNWQDD